MTDSPVYTITAKDLLGQGAYSSVALSTFADFLTEAKSLILSDTDDLERWIPHNQSIVIKLAQEFKYYKLFSTSDSTLSTIVTTPEFIWGLSRLRDNDVGVEYFFKMLNVPTMTEDIAKKPVLFYDNKDAMQIEFENRESAKYVHIDLTQETDPISKIHALNIFTATKVGVCTDYLLDFRLDGFAPVFPSLFQISMSYMFETEIVKRDTNAVVDLLSTTVTTDVNYQAVTETVTYP